MSNVRPFSWSRWTASRFLLTAGLVAFLAWFLLVWIDAAPHGNLHTGDTDNLVAGTRVALDCIHERNFSSCGLIPDTNYTTVGPYALLQYLPSTVFIKLFGASDDSVIRMLGHLSTVAYLAACAVGVLCFRENRRVWPIVLVALAFSSAAYQATSAFGEMLAAASVLFAVAAAIHRRPLLVAPLCCLASLSKETIPVFVVLLVLAAAHRPSSGWKPERSMLVATLAGAGGGVVAAAAFNVFRFGTPSNPFYLASDFRTAGLGNMVHFAAGLWFSPSSGIVVFWTIAFLLLVVAFIVLISRFLRRRAGADWLPLGIALAAGLIFVGGLATWFSPFGWITYGPRLAVPILPGLIVAVCKLAEPELTAVVMRIGRSTAVTMVAVLMLTAISIPNITAPWSWFGGVSALIAGDATCPPMTETSVVDRPDEYFVCTRRAMWRLHPSTVWAAVDDLHGSAVAGQVAGGLAAALLLSGAFVDDRRPGHAAGRATEPEPTSPSVV